MRVLAVAAIALLPLTLNATAAELKALTSIDAVTVFPQGAEITRVAKVTLTAGDQAIVLRDLPASLVSDSVRVQGEAAAKVDIGSVDTRVFYTSEDSGTAVSEDARKKLLEAFQALQDKQNALQATIDAANAQKQLVAGLVNLPGRPPATGTGTTAEPDWGQLFTLIGDRLNQASKTIAEAQIAQRDNAKKIEDLQRQLNQEPEAGDQRTEVKIHVTAAAPLEATLRIRYQIPAASWYPIYDARLETGDGKDAPKLSLVRRAIVSQETGEVWDNVQLALSTTRPQAGTSAPDLVPLSVDIAPIVLPYDASVSRQVLAKKLDEFSAEKDAEGGSGLTAGQIANAPAPEPVKPKSIAANVSQTRATTVTTAFQAVYVITDRQSIRSGVGDKRVQIDTMDLEPTLAVRAVPKFSETAYLYAKYKVGPDTLLLPGGTSLFRDGVFVGRGELPQLSGGEENELGFGADDKVRIKFANLGRKAGSSGIISTSKTDTQQFKITVKNLHARPIPIRVLDQLPVSLNELIKVEMSSASAPPTVRDVDDKRGLLAWDLTLDADKSQELAFGYQVIWPSDKAVVYDQRPGLMVK